MSFPRRLQRSVHGILLLDKPGNMSSNAALQKVKHLFNAQKAGHTGSLDPLASGMLPLCFGDATKFSQYLLEADKRYRFTAKLGIATTTGDMEGEVISEKTVPEISAAKLQEVLEQFTGAIQQVPSMYSALKHNGQPLYALARKGITVERAARTVIIREIILLEQTADTLTLEVACTKGTYIRTLVEDIGNVLGCGAHVAMLRRLTAGAYNEDQMLTMDMLEQLAQEGGMKALESHLLPVDTAVSHWPAINISEAGAYYLLRGQPIIVPHKLAPTTQIKLIINQSRFIGIGEILDDGKIAPRKLVSER